MRDQPPQTGQSLQSSETGMQYGNSISNASVSGTGQRQARDGVSTVSDRRLESREHPMSAELEFAVKSFDHVITTIDNDLKTMEGEVSLPLENQSETSLNEIRDFCIGIDTMIKKDLKDAAEKVSRLDVLKVTGAPQTMAERLTEFTSRLRTVQGTLRRTRTTVVLGSSIGSNASLTTGSRETIPTADSHRGYKPYIEKLKPPVFSGRVEDWPEFRSVWTELFSDLPESVQVQHVKTNVPAADSRRIAGVKTMREVWERLERVYGDTELNIITVKSTLESFTSKSNQDHKRIQDVYEAVEKAITQLQNLDAAKYLEDDFSLINKLVLKLPHADQRRYSDYVSSEAAGLDPRSKWAKFWSWLRLRYKSAVQSGLMHMCDGVNGQSKSVSSGIKTGVTCNICGGLGHYARNCSSKQRSVQSPSVKVNVAVTKVHTRDEYNRHLPETRRQVGNCLGCGQAAHNYTRQFPFGNADWPSTRLDTCKKFLGMTTRERGELVERLKACYKCTSWQHQGDACYSRGKSSCNVVSGGSVCGGVHNKLLHGSGVAFCHKTSVKFARSICSGKSEGNEVERLPDLNQPVLLEIQDIKIHGVMAKTMWDNGSTGAMITHKYAERAGLTGERVSYWLVVVGHDSVLRHTTLYTFKMIDNLGREHEIRAFGIDQITEDCRTVDLSGVREIFPGAPSEVFSRPSGEIDVLIGSMYRNIQPYGGEDDFMRGRLRLV